MLHCKQLQQLSSLGIEKLSNAKLQIKSRKDEEDKESLNEEPIIEAFPYEEHTIKFHHARMLQLQIVNQEPNIRGSI